MQECEKSKLNSKTTNVLNGERELLRFVWAADGSQIVSDIGVT